MKRLIFIIISLVISPHLFSQNLDLPGSVVSTAGDYSISGSYRLSWTVGETAVDLLSNSNYKLAVGFQQNWDKIVGIEDIENRWQVLTYPNPVTDKVFIRFANPGSSEILIELLDISGTKLFSEKMKNLLKDEIVTVDVSTLKNGLYLLNILSPGLKTNRVYKIIKQ